MSVVTRQEFKRGFAGCGLGCVLGPVIVAGFGCLLITLVLLALGVAEQYRPADRFLEWLFGVGEELFDFMTSPETPIDRWWNWGPLAGALYFALSGVLIGLLSLRMEKRALLVAGLLGGALVGVLTGWAMAKAGGLLPAGWILTFGGLSVLFWGLLALLFSLGGGRAQVAASAPDPPEGELPAEMATSEGTSST